jgi:hypothetical protein
MMSHPDGQELSRVCPRTGKTIPSERRFRWAWWLGPIVGFASLVWFLVRVIPKPSRAAYPCQRVAFPLASGFVVWLMGVAASLVAFRKAKRHLAQARYVLAAVCIVVSVASVYVALSYTFSQPTFAVPPSRVAQEANAPIGVAKGIHPGRVVWIHDANATDWLGSPEIQGVHDGYWWEPNHTSQAVVDAMMSKALRALTGEETDSAAWDAIFRYYNGEHGKGDVGYQSGEKIMVKVNLVGLITSATGTGVKSYSFRDNYPNTSPQAMHALLDQLVNVAGVDDGDITIGDTLCTFTNDYFNYLDPCFPDVHYLDKQGFLGRATTSTPSTNPRIYWSDPNSEYAMRKDYVATAYKEAEYVINFANLKGHYNQAGVTMCGKNHYGSLCRTPDASGYYNLHNKQIWSVPGMGHYRPLVDLMGHPEIGGKTILFLLDGLYPNKHALAWMRDFPYRWKMPPFNGDWASSIFASQDPVAIDSVGFDFLYAEWPEDNGPGGDGADDYLHEAALIPNPPSGYVYDPNHDGGLTESLGVHEHWNNPIDKQYSRNLGTGDGIELVTDVTPSTADLPGDSEGQ